MPSLTDIDKGTSRRRASDRKSRNQFGMNGIRHLEEIANEPNWIVFAKKLRAAMASFEELGLGSRNEVLVRVASLQSKDPASLQNPLTAEKWMADHAPKEHFDSKNHIAMTNVLLLKQIHSLSTKVAAVYHNRVFNSEVSRSELKQVLEKTKNSEGLQGAIGHERWQRAHEFSTLAQKFIFENLSRFTDHPNPVLRQRSKNASLPCDLEIWSEGVPIVAIEIKFSRQKSTRSSRAEILGLASLLSKEFLQVSLVFSCGPKKNLQELVKLRNELNLTNIRIATLDEDLSCIGHTNALKFW